MNSLHSYRKIGSGLAAILLASIIITPLAGLPVATGGIPVWYQDTFYFGWMALALAGGIALTGHLTGIFKPVRWNYVDAAALILLVYMAIRTAIMDFIPQSSWVQIAYFTALYGISRLLWPTINHKSIHLLIGLLLIAGIVEAGYGLGQLYGLWPSHHNLFPLTGSFFNPGPYSGWLACMVPLAVYGILSYKKKRSIGYRAIRYLSLIYLSLAALVLIPAASRAALLAAIGGSVVVAWPQIRKSKLWHQTWFKGVVATMLVVGMAGLYLMKKDSADGRLLIYKVTADMIADAPLWGWGWDGFPTLYNNFQALYFQSGDGSAREMYLADHVIYGFNEILEFTAEMGISGLILLTGVVALLFRKWKQSSPSIQSGQLHFLGPGLLISWCTFALFSYPMSIPALLLIFPLTISGINSILHHETSDGHTIPDLIRLSTPNFGIIATCLLLTITAYGLYWVLHYRPLTQEWAVANANQEFQRYEFANHYYRDLGPHFRNEGLFLQYAGKSLSLDRQFYESGYMLERALYFSADPIIFTTLGKDYTLFSEVDSMKKNRAEFLLNRAKYISPYKYYPRYLLARYYHKRGSEQKAYDEAEELLTIVPKVSSPATKEIRNEMQQMIDQDIFQTGETPIHISTE